MAFLAPLAAGAAGAGAAATGAGAALGSGLAAGTALGAGVGLKATGALLAPTLGTSLGAGLGSSMLAGGLGTAGAGLGGAGLAGLAGLGGLGLKAGAGSLLAPTLGATGAGLTGLGATGAGLSGVGLKAGAGMFAPNLGVAAPIASATPAVTPAAFKSFSPNASFLNTMTEGAAIPGVTSNLPAQMMGNVAGGPAIPGVTSALPAVSAPLAPASTASAIQPGANFATNLGNLIQNPSMDAAIDYAKEHPMATAAGALGISQLMKPKYKAPEMDKGMIRPYEFTRAQRPEAYAVSPLTDTSERLYFNDTFTPLTPYAAGSEESKKAEGGILGYAVGGPVEQMAAMNSMGANTGYPMAGINTPLYSNPMMQRPEATNVISPSGDAGVNAFSGEPRFAGGGLSDLGGYSDGGRLLKGPGDGVSDSIPAVIGDRQPARLADGEFVVPARIVSELGNGSTEAGARKLYAMMDRVQKARRKTVGKDRVAANTKADKHLPA